MYKNKTNNKNTIIIACIVALVIAVTVVAIFVIPKLNKGSSNVGLYTLDSVVSGETTMDHDMLESLGTNTDESYIELKDETNCKTSLNFNTTDCTYKLEGKNITITTPVETIEGTLEGDKITIDTDGSKSTFKK